MRSAEFHAQSCLCFCVCQCLCDCDSAAPINPEGDGKIFSASYMHTCTHIHLMNHHRYLGKSLKLSRVSREGSLTHACHAERQNVYERLCSYYPHAFQGWYLCFVRGFFKSLNIKWNVSSVVTGGAGECSGWWQRPPVEPEAEETSHPSLPQVQQREVRGSHTWLQMM